MVSAIDSALSGLAAEGRRIQDSAQAIARQNNQSPDQGVTDQLSLSDHAQNAQPQDMAQQMVDMNMASYGFKGDLKVIKVQDNLNKSLLDIKS